MRITQKLLAVLSLFSILLLGGGSLFAQNRTCQGTVTDAQGEPVIGASVLIKGAPVSTGVVTDMDGKFVQPNAKEGNILVVSCIGYATVEVPWSGSPLSIVMDIDENLLDETVVVGYGVQKKMNLSGAVATVKMEDVLGDRPQPNVAAALQGAIPGLYISSTSNTPGQTGKSIQIRGTASFSGSSTGVSSIGPLILIDNVPGELDALNPEDIETVTVLKDASASSIYGARAAAGVILITTKRPKDVEKVSINYSGTVGLVNAISTPKQVSTETLLNMYKEAFATNLYTAAQNQDIDKWLEYLGQYKAGKLTGVTDNGIYVGPDGLRYYLQDNDINQRMMETGSSQNHNIAVRGASNAIRFRMSANSYKENGPLYGKKDVYNRKAVNGVISADITKWLTQELDFYYTQQHRNMIVDEAGALYGQRNLQFLPDGVDPDGYLVRTPRNIIESANTSATIIEQPRVFTKTILRPIKGLEAVFEYTYQRRGNDYSYNSGKYTYTDIQLNVLKGPDHDYSIARRSYEARNAINAYATYRFEPLKDHHFTLMGGYNQEYWDYAYFNTRAEDQAILDIPSMSNAQGKITTSDSYADFATRSGFFRFNYDYAGKYIFEASGRYDGSSKFPKNHRFGFFPSFSIAWNIAQEGFMEGTRSWLNQLKPRFSYGSIGNQSSVGYYDYYSTMGLNTNAVTWLSGADEAYVTVLGMPGIVSDSFTWETITTTNAGLDFILFDNRLTGSFEWFRRDTKDILSQSVALPAVLGDDAPMQNVGRMRTQGWEFQIGWKGSIGSAVQYRADFNIWDYKSWVTKLNFNEEKSLSYLYEGKQVGEIWGYDWDGFYTVNDFSDLSTWQLKDGVTGVNGTSPRPGDFKYKNLVDGQYSDDDKNMINTGRGTATEPGDRRVIGNNTPRFQYGFNFGVTVAGFDLSVRLQGVGKRDYFSSGPYFYTYFGSQDAIWSPAFVGTENYWSPKSTDASSPDYYVAANPDAKLPRIYGNVGNGNYNRWNNTHMLSNAAYLRVKNVTLSYSFPKRLLQKVSVSSLRAFVSGENLATFTSLPNGIDPESLSWSYPLYRTISFGLNITL
jgi:TonB-linked outer membrane protein, SusC/RagA family